MIATSQIGIGGDLPAQLPFAILPLRHDHGILQRSETSLGRLHRIGEPEHAIADIVLLGFDRLRLAVGLHAPSRL